MKKIEERRKREGSRLSELSYRVSRMPLQIKNVHQLKSIDGVKYQLIQPLQNVGQLGLFKAAG